MSRQRYVALLRAVNVGGRNRVPMALLREEIASLGFGDVATYIQSGNVVLSAPDGTRAQVAQAIEGMLTAAFGVESLVVVRTGTELESAASQQPYGEDCDPARVLIAFLDGPPAPELVAAVDHDRYLPDRLVVRGREAFLHCPDGAGRSRLVGELERRLGVRATIRNLATVRRLAEMALGA